MNGNENREVLTMSVRRRGSGGRILFTLIVLILAIVLFQSSDQAGYGVRDRERSEG